MAPKAADSAAGVVLEGVQTYFVEGAYKIETGEAERIAVDYASKPSGTGTEGDTDTRESLFADYRSPSLIKGRAAALGLSSSQVPRRPTAPLLISHASLACSAVVSNLTTQRSAIKMLFDRINVCRDYVAGVREGTVPRDNETLRQINSIMCSMPAIDSPDFRDEFLKVSAGVLLSFGNPLQGKRC